MTKHTILFLAANPRGAGTGGLDSPARRGALDQEASAIQRELKLSGHRDRFEFVTRWAAEPYDLLRELRVLKPRVVHFSGHGSREGLFFEASNGDARVVSASAIAETFGAAGGSVKLVVLSACYSEAAAEALLEHVDCIIEMSGALHDDMARAFAIGFYGALGEQESVAAAYEHGNAAASLEGLAATDRPQLKVRVGVDATRIFLAADARVTRDLDRRDSELPSLLIRESAAPEHIHLIARDRSGADALGLGATGGKQESPASNLYYYCYISESKVDQLLSQLPVSGGKDAAVETFCSSRGALARMILGTYPAGGQYGHPAVASIHWSRERRQDLVLRLLAALLTLERTVGDTPSLCEVVQEDQAVRSGVYMYEGEFTARRYDSHFVHLESILINGALLKLTCSLKYFSDICDPSGNLVFHSGNVQFLSGEVSPFFHTLFYLLQNKGRAMVGTPLFLGLPLNSSIQL